MLHFIPARGNIAAFLLGWVQTVNGLQVGRAVKQQLCKLFLCFCVADVWQSSGENYWLIRKMIHTHTKLQACKSPTRLKAA